MSGLIADDTNRCEKFKHKVKEVESTVRTLEDNLKESISTDNKVIQVLKGDTIKFDGLTNQLEEALRENKQLLNILQQKCSENDLSRSNSQVDLSSSCSTMSIVHLQYKYEELLASHHGLLKLLESRRAEIKRVNDDNSSLKGEMDQLKSSLSRNIEKVSRLHKRIATLRERKDLKIHKLKTHKDTMQLVHNQLVDLLHKQCMEKNRWLEEEIKVCKHPEKAQLLEEIRKNNLLSYQNFQLNQKVEYLKSLLKMKELNLKKVDK